MGAKRYVICDIEATGLDHDRDLIEIALITWEEGQVIDVYETLVNPLRPIPVFISDLTSITNRDLKEAPKFYDVADAIRTRLEGAVFVSHNTDFDLGLLRKKYQEMGQELKVKNFCTLKVAQFEIPGLQNYNLDALCRFFDIKIEDRHRAIGDAKATLALFKELLQLRLKTYPRILFLPHHEKMLKKIPTKAGLVTLRNEEGKLLRLEASNNMEKTARELLEIKQENHELLLKTSQIETEVTGSALIAEFRKLQHCPYRPHWVIVTADDEKGEKFFRIRPYRKGLQGLWYFRDYFDAKKKLQHLVQELRTERVLYREGGKTKEEIVRHNQKIEKLSREARFPKDHLVFVGEGRSLGERSVILVRNNHVLGYGYTMASEESIYAHPDSFITTRFAHHLGVDLAARKYIRILKNLRHKMEAWRSLAEVR
jgi:DNA polymerase-3 subunit epsilon